MPITIQVSAIDQQGVTKFFDENEALVGNAMFKAYQRSTLMRNRVGR